MNILFKNHMAKCLILILLFSQSLYAQNFKDDYREILSTVPENAVSVTLIDINKLKSTPLKYDVQEFFPYLEKNKDKETFPRLIELYSFMKELKIDLLKDLDLFCIVTVKSSAYSIPYSIIKLTKEGLRKKSDILETTNQIQNIKIVDPNTFEKNQEEQELGKKKKLKYVFFPKEAYMVISEDKDILIPAFKAFEGTNPNFLDVIEKKNLLEKIKDISFFIGIVNVDIQRDKDYPIDTAPLANISCYLCQFYFSNNFYYETLHYLAHESSDLNIVKKGIKEYWEDILPSLGLKEVNISADKSFINVNLRVTLQMLAYSM